MLHASSREGVLAGLAGCLELISPIELAEVGEPNNSPALGGRRKGMAQTRPPEKGA